MPLNEFQNESEKIFILKMLNDYKFNISQTANALSDTKKSYLQAYDQISHSEKR